VIHRAGTDLVNWYLLEQEARVTIVDAGCPAYRGQLDDALRAIGRTIEDVEAIVLTHAHADHVGFAGLLQEERGIPVHAQVDELTQAKTAEAPPTEKSFVPALFRHRTARRLIFHLARNGAARPPKVARVEAFRDGDEIDVPGRPRAVATPGHSPGHCVLDVPAEGAAFVGDALMGWNTITGRRGPILPPPEFNLSTAEARRSLDRIETLTADTLYYGHGDPWTGGAAEAVAEARAR
jgi:glyoxylase-like metal-dependent hydrolase (beta-lactamase superfamily II)